MMPHFIDQRRRHAGRFRGTNREAGRAPARVDGGFLRRTAAERGCGPRGQPFRSRRHQLHRRCGVRHRRWQRFALPVYELETRSSEVVVAAAADMMQTPFGYLCFSKTQALSPTGQCRTFDESADGIVISEGIAVAILKRLEDARAGWRPDLRRDQRSRRIQRRARTRGSPRHGPIGQMRGARARLLQGRTSIPVTVGLIEAHGTGTVAGDRSEVESLTHVLRSAVGANRQLRARLGKEHDRPHQVHGRLRRPGQGRPGAASQGAAAHHRRDQAEPQSQLPGRRRSI